MQMPTKMRKGDVPAVLLVAFPGYRGRKYRLDVKGYVTLCDLSWGGGTRSQYTLVSLDGQGMAARVDILEELQELARERLLSVQGDAYDQQP